MLCNKSGRIAPLPWREEVKQAACQHLTDEEWRQWATLTLTLTLYLWLLVDMVPVAPSETPAPTFGVSQLFQPQFEADASPTAVEFFSPEPLSRFQMDTGKTDFLSRWFAGFGSTAGGVNGVFGRPPFSALTSRSASSPLRQYPLFGLRDPSAVAPYVPTRPC